ncbi:MAG: type II toxin-antitoxin system VapC family toxin [Actinobacteria bacterium]|nr:type II toxin-antitoxin system VapC family toxin [Actinomycetota bacterium]
MIVYLDTSALVKILIEEEGSEDAAVLWSEADRIYSSRLAYLEARAALAASLRTNRSNAPQHNEAKAELERRWRQLSVVEMSSQVAGIAGEVAEDYGLRGYDAVHLASAFASGGGNITLVTWDRDLAHAGLGSGLGVAPAPIP